MLNEMRMKNVFKIELRSPNKMSYENIYSWFSKEGVDLKEVRGKFDTYWITPNTQIELGVDCFYIGANGDLASYQLTGWVFDNFVINNFPFSNFRQVKTDINNYYNEDGIDKQIHYARDRRKSTK